MKWKIGDKFRIDRQKFAQGLREPPYGTKLPVLTEDVIRERCLARESEQGNVVTHIYDKGTLLVYRGQDGKDGHCIGEKFAVKVKS